MTPEDQTALDIVKLGYAVDDPSDSRRCLSFTARFDSLEAAQEACRAIDSYNGFDGETVAAALAECAQFGALRSVGFSIGREGSPCIYVNQIDTRQPAYVEKVKNILLNARADEVDEVSDGAGTSFGQTVRAWWD